ncbi:MAG: NUDIX hydrolase [Abitibacteriaceae bacterium]|nr:NUDIX hydrolase [Abditibacteriaceae bacterium]
MEESAVWGNGLLPLQIASHLSHEVLPVEFITSVRCVLLRGEAVLVVRNLEHSYHILPGGRRESGESLEATLRREILEETGWVIAKPHLLGFKHFHHLSPKPEGYRYPYPDFVQLIYAARAEEFMPNVVISEINAENFEGTTEFLPLTDVLALELTASDRLYLNAALKFGL